MIEKIRYNRKNIIIILIIIELISLFLVYKTFPRNKTILDEVKLQENTVKNDGFALMLQKEDGTYEKSNSSSWPTDMVFNAELSGCIDTNGNKIENSLSFDKANNIVNVSVGETSYCYVYFDLDNEAPIVTVTINNNGTKEATMTINSNKDGIYCVNTSFEVTDMNNCLFEGNIKENENLTTGIINQANNYYVHIRDKFGNIGVSEEIKISNNIYNYLIDNITNGTLWKSTLEGDGYRFIGTNPNNYICFGTSNKDTCLNDTDKYMYRIIGIFEDSSGNKHAKLIKKERIGNGYTWYKDDYADIDWNESDLYKGLNGSYFLTNTSYPYMQDSTWNNKIATWNYTMTNTKTMEYRDPYSSYPGGYYGYTGKEIYLHELNRSTKTSSRGEWKSLNAKISLMYVSDYALSLGEQSLNYTGEDNSDKLVTGWIHLWNNDGYEVDDIEWTMSRAGCEDGDYCRAWGITKDGDIMYTAIGLDSSSDVRPVFYLESSLELLSGTGTIRDPYLIK